MRLVGLGIAAMLVLAGLALWVQGRADSSAPAEQAAVDEWAADEEPDVLALPVGTKPVGGSRIPRAPAATKASKEERRFARYDRDRDGTIRRDEMLGTRVKAFRKLDTNGDSFLSFEEWAVATTKKFDGADRDRSATLTPAEFATTAPKRVAKATCRC